MNTMCDQQSTLNSLYQQLGEIYAAVEIDLTSKDYNHKHLHLIHVPSINKKGGYHQGRKMSSFAHGYNVNRHPRGASSIHSKYSCSSTRLFHCKQWYELVAENARQQTESKFYNSNYDDRYLSTTFYADVEDFFSAVGYDRLKKRLR